MTYLLVFACGAFYEFGCVFWGHYSERSEPLKTAGASMLLAAAEVTGIFESVHEWRHAPFFVVGYGAGTYLGVWLKTRLAPRQLRQELSQ